MKTVATLMTVLLLACLNTGCHGLSTKPMPERLSDEQQREYDYGWDQLVAQRSAAERETLLDALLLSQAWHAGVDRFQLVAEKDIGDITVVMESTFLRELPDEDTFTVTFLNPSGAVLRSETYAGVELDAAVSAYLVDDEPDLQEGETLEQYADRMRRVAERDRRVAAARALFPAPPEAAEDTSSMEPPVPN